MALVAFAAATNMPIVAFATPSSCPDASAIRADARGSGPLPSGNGPADFGMVPEACPAFDFLFGVRSALLIASTYPDYYGNITSRALFRIRYLLLEKAWISVAFDLLSYRYINNGGLASHGFGLGPPTIGAYRLIAGPAGGALAIFGRILLPIDTTRESGVQFGGEVGATAWVPLRARFGFQTGLTLPLPIVLVGGQIHGAFQPVMTAELFARVGGALALFAGASFRAQAAPESEVQMLAIRAAARFALARGFNLAVASEIPVPGSAGTGWLGATSRGRAVDMTPRLGQLT